MIKEEDGKFVVYDVEENMVGSYDTREEAEAELEKLSSKKESSSESDAGMDSSEGLTKAIAGLRTVTKAFSDAARAAAIEARRAKGKGKADDREGFLVVPPSSARSELTADELALHAARTAATEKIDTELDRVEDASREPSKALKAEFGSAAVRGMYYGGIKGSNGTHAFKFSNKVPQSAREAFATKMSGVASQSSLGTWKSEWHGSTFDMTFKSNA